MHMRIGAVLMAGLCLVACTPAVSPEPSPSASTATAPTTLVTTPTPAASSPSLEQTSAAEPTPGATLGPSVPATSRTTRGEFPSNEASTQLSARLSHGIAGARPDQPALQVALCLLSSDEDRWLTHEPDREFPAASTVKIDVAMVFLHEKRRLGQRVTADQAAWLRAMIATSDNAATDAIVAKIGGMGVVERAWQRWGLTDTRVSDDYWLNTTTTCRDRIRVLRVFDSADPYLAADDRRRVGELLDGVVPEQRWGVSVLGPARLKNGWLDGVWARNSVGIVDTAEGDHLLVAALSLGWNTHPEGIPGIEQIIRLAGDVWAGRPA